jgi:hypothetical protein
MNHDTNETQELIAAGATLYREIAQNGSGNLIRLGISLADDLPTLVAGLHGANLVPSELADLSEEEAQELELAIAKQLGDITSPPVLAAIKASAAATLAGVVAVKAWRAALATNATEGVRA